MIEESKYVYVSVTKDNTVEYPLHCHDFWEIMCYIDGKGVMRTDKGDISFQKGTVICIPPHCVHGSYAKEPFKNISIGFSMFSFLSDEPLIVHENEGTLYDLIGMIYKLYYEDSDQYRGVLLNLLAAVAKLIVLRKLNAGSVKAVELLKERMILNFTDCYFSLPTVIATLPYTDDYIRTCFKKQEGKTPLQYLTGLRLHHADDLITRNPTEKIASIAMMSGFSDPLYFSRVYKQKFGISPLQKRAIEQQKLEEKRR